MRTVVTKVCTSLLMRKTLVKKHAIGNATAAMRPTVNPSGKRINRDGKRFLMSWQWWGCFEKRLWRFGGGELL